MIKSFIKSHETKQTKQTKGRRKMKSFGTKALAGGSGSVPVSNYKSKGLRNKRKSHWSQLRKDAQAIKEMKEKNRQVVEGHYENFDEFGNER